MVYTKQTWEDGSTAHPLSAARLGHMEDGIEAAHALGGGSDGPDMRLETFPGATDDARLTAAMSYASSQTYKPAIRLLEGRVYGPFTTVRTVYSGFKLTGPEGFGNQYRGALSTTHRVDVNTSGAWLRTPTSGSVFDVEVSRLSLYSLSSTCDFFETPGTSVLWTSLFRDLGISLFRHAFGNATRQFVMTDVRMDGYFNVNNGRGVSMRFGGSDCTLFPLGCLLDSPTSFTDGGAVPYHLWCDSLEKSLVGPMFITGEGIPAAIRIQGSATSGSALIFGGGLRAEGRNAGAPSRGAVVRMEGGHVTFRDAWLSYGLASPGTSGRTGEAGVVSVLGGRALFDGCFYSRAGTSGVGEEVPWIYASGSGTQVRVRNAQVAHDGGTFTGLPRVQAANGATIDADNSVTVL